MNYIQYGKEIFKNSILNRFSLKFNQIGNSSFSLQGKKYSLDFTMNPKGDGTEISFNLQNSNNENEILTYYYFEQYILSFIDSTDREIAEKYPRHSVFEVAVNDLYIYASILERHLSSILSGDMSWFEEYKKSQYYQEPRICSAPH